MSTSTRVIGFVPPDERWQRMQTIWQACKDAGIDPPPEVERFFEDGEPDPNGQQVPIPSRDWSGEMRQGIEIDISAIPNHVKTIRFVNSW